MVDAAASTLSFVCPCCGQKGVAWDMHDGVNRYEVSSGFHLEIGRLQPSEVAVVCDHCDQIQPSPAHAQT